jgi:hypothetical protein
MACHYVFDEEIGKVLIPGCMAVAISNDKEDCTCRSYRNFEKERYNELSKRMKESIMILQEVNNELIEQIEKLKKKSVK